MIYIFGACLFLTFALTRIASHALHDAKNYGTDKECSKTLTFYFRKKTGLDIHHVHFGFVGLIFCLWYFLIFGLDNFLTGFFGIFLSLVLDQIIPLCDNNVCYFDKRSIFEAFLLHVFIFVLVGIFVWV